MTRESALSYLIWALAFLKSLLGKERGYDRRDVESLQEG